MTVEAAIEPTCVLEDYFFALVELLGSAGTGSWWG